MKRALLLLSVTAFGQAPDGYFVVNIYKVKPSKRVDFDAAVKKLVDANRRNNGLNVTGSEVVFGEINTVYITRRVASYQEIEDGRTTFMGALAKAMGEAGIAKVMQDVADSIESSRSEVRRTRNDLSRNAPADVPALNRVAGESRWIRTVSTRIRPGRINEYTQMLQAVKAAGERSSLRTMALITQTVAGASGTVVHSSLLAKSMGEFDIQPGAPTIQQMLGPPGYQNYLNVNKDVVLSTGVTIRRYVPALSNPTEETVQVSPDFWRPKPAIAAKPKPAEAKKQ